MKTVKQFNRLIGVLCVSALLLVTGMAFAACGSGAENESSANPAEGSAPPLEEPAVPSDTMPSGDFLQAVLDAADTALGDESPFPELLTDPVAAENAPGLLGLLADDFVGYVSEATVATAAINTSAFEIALIKCNSADDAAAVESMIHDGFDSGKWICVMPEQSLTSVSGSYVLLAVGGKTQTDAIAAAFSDVAGGTASEPSVFYAGETGGDMPPVDGASDGGELILG